MAAPSVGDAPEGFGDLAPSGLQGNDEKSARLVLSDVDRTREAILAARIAVEHARVVGAVDSRATARYAAQVVDNSRRLAGGDASLHLRLLREHTAWLRSLPTEGGLRW